MAEHGSRQSYADGCRCALCKGAQAEYRRANKAQKAGATVTSIGPPGRRPKGAVSPPPVSAPVGVGPNEQATLEELATLTSAETRKAVAAGALTMARILDNPLALGQQPQAFARLSAAMADLRQGATRRKGRLASVQSLMKPTATGTDA